MTDGLDIRWRDPVTDGELVVLMRSTGGGGQPGWWERIRPRSLGWVTARVVDGRLVGFVNVAWDGAAHAFLLDTTVDPEHRRRGAATEIVRVAAQGARRGGCEWLHVDFEPHLRSLYWEACGFRPTDAGLIHLA